MSRGARSLNRRRLAHAGSATLLAACLLAAPATAAARTPETPAPMGSVTLPTPVVRQLDNGLKVMVFPVHRLPIVQVQLLVPGGSADAPEDAAGIASLTAACLRQGTPSRDPVQLARETEALGATITAVAGRDYTLVGTSFLVAQLDAGLELFSDVVLRPGFPPDGVERLKREALGTVLQTIDNPVTSADEELWTLALPGHAYGRPPAGTLEDVPSLGVSRVRAFYRDHYRPDRCVLAIAGDVDPDRTVAAVTEWFGSWSGRAGEKRPIGTATPPRLRVRIVDRPELPSCEIRVGEAGPARGSEDDLPMAIANWVFGGSTASRLARSGAGNAHSGFTPLRAGGLLAISATARVDSAGAVARAILDALKRFTEQPPSEAELATARRYFADVYPLPFETLAGITAQALAADFYGLPADFSTRYEEHLNAITPAAVAAAVRRWADPARAVVVVVGPADKLRPQLEALGALEVLPAGGTIAGAPPSEDEKRRGRERITQAVEAHGGRAKLEGIHGSSVTSEVMLGIGENAIRGEMILARAEPERMVMITKVQGQQTRQVLDGGRTWTETDVDTIPPKEGDSLAVGRMRSTYESDLPHLLLAALKPEALVADRGRDRLGDREVDRIEVAIPGGPRRRFLLDAQTHRVLALDEPGRSGVGFGARRLYADYRQVDGVWWAFHEERIVDGERVIAFEVKTVSLNGDVPSVFFQPSAPKAR